MDDHGVPDIGRLVRLVADRTDGAAPHLVAEDEAADPVGQYEAIDNGRVPAFPEQGFRADDDLDQPLREELGDPAYRMGIGQGAGIDLHVGRFRKEGSGGDNPIGGQGFVGDLQQTTFGGFRDNDQRAGEYSESIPVPGFLLSPQHLENGHGTHFGDGAAVVLGSGQEFGVDIVGEDDHAEVPAQGVALKGGDLRQGFQFGEGAFELVGLRAPGRGEGFAEVELTILPGPHGGEGAFVGAQEFAAPVPGEVVVLPQGTGQEDGEPVVVQFGGQGRLAVQYPKGRRGGLAALGVQHTQ